MEAPMRAIEVVGTIDDEGHLRLEEPLTNVRKGPVRVILLLPENGDLQEREWLRLAANDPALDFLKDPAEDIYAADDGQPFDHKG